ncbi:tRNA (guanine-N7-)-methyltransferase [Sedimentibacter acidaminivorans]|jgi:tRNA (guanine-N7-)-methyltransferase|uniref:tRNA (guanine-N(7)-)-methyltransferase n=1 Tax=Sedimentibacter acidaminivorans TaxID=913099 RepID=A0ABS4GDZ4_9FIRM|nr:tRNA (guanosine(46)-N7)-methyltransferase TrmB [Sedimentibacter acidaminivorans]MBP1925926.1 tRNA (guanine-N7-)-methyltransferase [Sedimentibacter acidaminivorans]
MRLRYVPGQYEYLQQHDKAITEPEKMSYKLNDVFKNNNPLHVELGCGKGKFLRETALKNPNINYIGFEKSVKVAYRCAKSVFENDPDNYYIVYSNGDIIKDVFFPNSIERIYLNFSDPWPKPSHYKRRMTHKNFLDVYRSVLTKNGEIHMKTDNDDLFEYSVLQFQEDNWDLIMVNRDLHNSPYNEENIMTEYEEKFAEEGRHINKLIARNRG